MLSVTPNTARKIVRIVEYPQSALVNLQAAANWSAWVWHGEGTWQICPDEYPVEPKEGKVIIGMANINKPPQQCKLELRSQQSFLARSLLRECREQSLSNSVRYCDKPVAEECVKCRIDFEVGPVIAHRIASAETNRGTTTKFPRVGRVREQSKLKPYEN